MLLLDLQALTRVITVVALVLASLTAARVVLRDVPVRPSFTTRSFGPAARGLLLMNPRSGGGRVARFDLENEARIRAAGGSPTGR